MTVADVLQALEQIAPKRLAFSFDHVGLQVGSPEGEVRNGATCLDLTLDKARALSPKTVVIAHHPLIWTPLEAIRTDRIRGEILAELLKKDCALIAAHTNWDVAAGGINDTLAERLGLMDVVSFGSAPTSKKFKVNVFVPPSALESIFDAAARAGAGVIGQYDQCSFRTEGEGTFRGSLKSNPTVGKAGQLERVAESRLEMVVMAERKSHVEAAIRRAHPYEEPAIDWIPLSDEGTEPIGRIGSLPSVMPLSDFRELVDEKLGTRSQVTGMPDLAVRRVAVTGGAAGDEWGAAVRAGADVFVTGEFKHHELVDASTKGLATVEAGHYATEQPGMESLRDRLSEALPKLEWKCLPSQIGECGASW